MLSSIVRFFRRPKPTPIPEYKYHVSYWCDGIMRGATMTTTPIPMVEDDLRAFRQLLQMDHGTKNIIITSCCPESRVMTERQTVVQATGQERR